MMGEKKEQIKFVIVYVQLPFWKKKKIFAYILWDENNKRGSRGWLWRKMDCSGVRVGMKYTFLSIYPFAYSELGVIPMYFYIRNYEYKLVSCNK